jgi:response regulator RpfG family c-di-GMP phosphodiesterase
MSTPRKLTLLVVDDEPEICNSVYDLLHLKYRVLRAHSAAEAVEMMGQHEVEIIMTDQRMPEVTGVEMLQKIRSNYPEAIRMLFTGYSDIRSVIAAINQGHVFRYLSKPWQPEELEAAVDDAAMEYGRLVDRTETCRQVRDRIAELESENQRLRSLLDERPS